jgi:hypothetical protein
MNNDWDGLLDALATGLRTQVAPHLATEQARIQLNAVVYALANLRLQGGWSAALLLEHVQAQQELFARVRELLPESGLQFPAADEVNDVTLARDRGDEAVNALIDHLCATPPAERGAAWHAARAALVDHLRRGVAIDRRRTAKSMMHELSGPGSEQLA